MGKTTKKMSGFYVLDKGVDEYHSAAEMDNRRLRGNGKTHDIWIDNGVIRKRPGGELYNIPVYDKCYGLHEYIDPDGTAILLMATKQAVYEVGDTSLTERDSGLAEEELHFHTHRGRCFYNGASTQRKITSTTAARVGIVAPSAAPTVAKDGTGLTGSYAWKFTYCIKESGVVIWESDPSPVSSSLSCSNEGTTVTPSASSDSRVNARRIYRTSAGGSTYQYEGEIDNNTSGATFSSGSVTDANLGDFVETNHGDPAQGIVSEGCNERMFWLDNSSSKARLRWSEQAYTEPYQEYQKTTSYRELPSDGKGVWLKRLYNPNTQREDLYVGQESGIHVLPQGDPALPLATISREVGGIQQDTVQEYRGRIVFLSKQQIVYMITGGRLIDITSRNIPDSMDETQNAGECRAGVIFNHFYALSAQGGLGTQIPDVVWICDLRTVREVEPDRADAVWFPWNVNFSYMLQRNNGDVIVFDEDIQRLRKLSFDNRQDEYGDGFFSESMKGVPLRGTILGGTGTITVTYKLYDAETGGTLVWTEMIDVVVASSGAFSTELGKSNAVPSTVLLGFAAGTTYYLGISIAGNPCTQRIALPNRAFLEAKAITGSYTLTILAEDITAAFATKLYGAENPSARRMARMIYIKGKQQRKISVTPVYMDHYEVDGTEATAEREGYGTVFVGGSDVGGDPGTQVPQMMSEPLEDGEGGAVSFEFEKSDEDAYFEIEGIQFSFTEFQRA